MAASKRTRRPVDTVGIRLSGDEIEDLVQLAQYYERSMGFMRHVVRLTSPRPIRERFKFVAEESEVLKAFAEAAREEYGEAGGQVTITPRTLVAFWGRALSSLESRRSRRRMSVAQLQQREALAATLQRSAERLWLEDPGRVAEELTTRRGPEAEWMRSRLEQPAP